MSRNLAVVEVPGSYAICRLAADAPMPQWPRGAFVSVSRTPSELSIVCATESVPEGVQNEPGWRCVAVKGPIPFEVTGVAAGLTAPLANAGIPLFLVSTFDTDYLLVKDEYFDNACAALAAHGWTVERAGAGDRVAGGRS